MPGEKNTNRGGKMSNFGIRLLRCRFNTCPIGTGRVDPIVRALIVAGVFLSGVNGDSAQAQTALQNAAQNPQQFSVATNIVDICPQLAGLGGFGLTGDVGDLFDRCNGAIVIAPGQPAAAADVLGQIAAEEILSQGSVVNGTIEPQTQAIAARMSALRGGGGLVGIANAQPNSEPVQLASTDPWQVISQDSTVSASHYTGLGAFMTGTYAFGNRDETSLEAGFDFDNYSITVGTDYFFSDNLVAGLAFGYTASDIDFDANAGGLDGSAYAISVYSIWNPIEPLGVSGFISYGLVDFETERNLNYTDSNGAVNRTISGDTDADQLEATGGIYYDFASGPWTFGPTGRVSYLHMDIDGFTETGGQGLDLVFTNQDAESFETAFGGAVSYSTSTSFGVALYQARAEWIHEFLDNSRTVSLRYENDPFPNSPVITLTTEEPDRDRFIVGGSASFVFQGGISAFADIETVLGLDNVTAAAVTAGLRMEF
ncbi:MAG: autotransporter outer membrane beta-barrel domain-containing protein [Alphaproteobacteria bacterium]|nr:autotransporter outer membrane beta-barrel domain-containing protein [Alphaproteobacteria bacterium]